MSIINTRHIVNVYKFHEWPFLQKVNDCEGISVHTVHYSTKYTFVGLKRTVFCTLFLCLKSSC